jgi:hypothetical protein
VVLAIIWALLVPAADWLAHHDVGAANGKLYETALDNARNRLLTLGAGLVAVGALIFTARSFALSREGQVTDRYSKAITQLGDEKLEVRIGGIYALERIARDSARDHPTVMEVFASFVRERSKEHWPPPGTSQTDRYTRPDIQAAMTVIGRRNAERDIPDRPIDLYHAILIRANLRGANLRGAILSRVVFTGAVLADADLSGAVLTDVDGLESADLTGAKWPEGTQVPHGWTRDAGSGRLERAGRPGDQNGGSSE